MTVGGKLQRLLGGATEIQVNSLHQQGLDRVADDLQAEARAPDGLVEAVSHRADLRFLLGVQWHPEWRFRESPASSSLFAAFGEAARGRARKGGA